MAERSVPASKENKKYDIVAQEKVGFEKFSIELKESVFQVLYLILKEEDDSLFSFMFSVAADYLQNLAFFFNQKVNSVWKANSLLEIIFNFFNFFQLSTYFGEAFTFTSYLIMFYLIIAVIILMIINIIYVSYAFSKKRVSAIWPVVVLRSVTSMVCTLFFLPVTEILISMVQCTYDEEGRYVHESYPEIQCFVGAHIIHATVAIIVNVVFMTIGFIVSLAYFEVRMLTEDATARQHSRGDVFFILNKISLQLSFTFFPDSAQWGLILVLVTGAVVLWLTYNIGEPYYRKECSIFFKIITTYYLWTAILVVVSKILENTSFTGGLVAWIIALPFIGVIILTSSKSRASSLVQSTSRFRASEQLLDHLRFVLQLMDTYKTDRNASILLTGYIEKHKDTCEEEDCPLKVKVKRKHSSAHPHGIQDMFLGLTLVVDRMYQTGIKKFRNSVKLRIAYSVFLIERMRNTKKAEQELAKAKELNPGFEDQFTIFRLTKLISDGLEGVDVVGLIAWESYKNLYHDYVKESANLHKEFWLELREDNPDLRRLNFLGSKVNNAMNYAKDYWSRIQKIRPDDPTILRTYGRFLIDIQNDNVEGYELIQRAKKLLSKKIYHQITRRNSFDVGTDQYPYVEVIGNGTDMGKVKHANLLFTILVGVNRDELIDKKINNFMPDLFGQYHDSFLRNYNMKDEDVDINYLDNDNELFVKSRSGYIIPVTIRVSRLKTEEASNQVVFGAWFRNENTKRNYVYFICQPDGTITDMTATAITTLNLSINQVRKSKMTIDKIASGALTDKAFREGAKDVLYRTESNSSVSISVRVLPIQLRDSKNRDFIDLYQSINAGKSVLANDGTYGYIVKIEKSDKNTELPVTELSRNLSGDVKNQRRESNFLELDQSMSRRFSKIERGDTKGNILNDDQIIYGFNTEHEELEITELFQGDGVKFDFQNLMKGDNKVERKKMDYGADITLKKYINGRLIEITEDYEEQQLAKRKEWEEDDQDEGSLFLRNVENLSSLDVKKRKDRMSALKRLVKDALETNTGNAAISTLKSLTVIWVISIFLIGIVQFRILADSFSDYKNKLLIMELYSEKVSEITKINSLLTDFLTFNDNTNIETDYSNSIIDERRTDIKDSVHKIVNLIKELEDKSLLPFLDPFDNEDIILQIYSTASVQQKSYTETEEAILFITSRAFELHAENISDFNLSNPEVATVLLNYVNEILPALRSSALVFKDSLVKSLETFEYKLIILYSLNFVVAVLASLWGMKLLMLIEQQKENVLFLFLEIPPRNVEGISRKRDKFMEFFEAVTKQEQNNQADDNSSDSDVDLKNARNTEKENVFDSSLNAGALSTSDPNNQEEEEDALKKRKKLINKYKSTNFERTKDSAFKVLFLVIFGLIISVSNYLGMIYTKAEVLNYTKQFYANNFLADTILSTVNLNRLMTIEPTSNINGQNIKQVAFTSLQELDRLGSDLAEFFLYIIDKNSDFETKVKALFFGDACQFLAEEEANNCRAIEKQPLKLGFFNLKVQIFKQLLDIYDNFQDTDTISEDGTIELFKISDDFKQWAYNILLDFNGYEKDYLQSILDDASNLQEIILIIYLILVVFMVVILWLPFIFKLNSEVWRTTRMINMIPLDVVNNIQSIKRFLKGLTRKSTG